jgi:ABC-type transporter Mla maintaining outer membrane lipid asymmetry permease subunit MlaE
MPTRAVVNKLKLFFLEVEELSDLSLSTVLSIFSKAFDYREFATQMDKSRVGSLFIILLTGFFTGVAMSLQALLQLKPTPALLRR